MPVSGVSNPESALVDNDVAFPSAAAIADVDTEHVEAPTEVESVAALLAHVPDVGGRPTERMLPDDETPNSAVEFRRPDDISTENRLDFLDNLKPAVSDLIDSESEPSTSTEAYPPYQPPANDEETALLDLDALVDQAGTPEVTPVAQERAAAPQDVSTRRLDRPSAPIPFIQSEQSEAGG